MNQTNNNLDLYEFLPRFKHLQVERDFRAMFLNRDKLLARIIFVGAILVALLSIIPDSLTSSDFASLQGLHLSSFAFMFFSMIMLGCMIHASHYRQYDTVTSLWWVAVIASVTVGNVLYPADMIIHVIFDIIIPVAIYLLIPIGLITQFLLAALFSIANLGILFTLKTGLTSTEASFIVVDYTTVHFLGIISCWQIHLSRRKQYIEPRSEQLTRQALEESRAEINVLRGIIPIFAYCKQIRDDEGFWHQVESYIRKHSGADFTHGICPGCMQEHFPREYDKIRAQELREKRDQDE